MTAKTGKKKISPTADKWRKCANSYTMEYFFVIVWSYKGFIKGKKNTTTQASKTQQALPSGF